MSVAREMVARASTLNCEPCRTTDTIIRCATRWSGSEDGPLRRVLTIANQQLDGEVNRSIEVFPAISALGTTITEIVGKYL